MKKTLQKTGFIVVFLMLATILFAQEQPPLAETPGNFRINVVAGQNAQAVGDRLNLVLELLNNGPKDIVFIESNGPAPIPDEPTDGDSGIMKNRVGKLGLSYNINLILPNTDDPKVFNAIFKTLKENLL